MLDWSGELEYNVSTRSPSKAIRVEIWEGNSQLAKAFGGKGKLSLANATPWWPIGMGKSPIAKLYTLRVS